jgi:arginase
MCLALSVGRGDSPLARLAGSKPLVRADDAALIGRRDQGQAYGHDALAASGILDVPGDILERESGAAIAASVLDRVGRPELDGFWIHLDADVLAPGVMPAVDSPEPGGPGLDGLAALVTPLARHPKALGMQVTIYDPALDPDRSSASRLIALIDRILADSGDGGVR